MIKQIIFDLDGTLIDSAKSIITGFKLALNKFNLTPAIELNQNIIGPPLNEILPLISGSTDPDLLASLSSEFKQIYDSEAYRDIDVYPEIISMLDQLTVNNIPLYIATNKRLIPTLKICEHLKWQKYFTDIYALDYFTPAIANKALMLKQILAINSFLPNETLYLGDRHEDGLAASENNMPFIIATWGYSEANYQQWQTIDSPLKIFQLLP